MKTMSVNHSFFPCWAHRTSFPMLIQDSESGELSPSMGTLHILPFVCPERRMPCVRTECYLAPPARPHTWS